MNEPEDDDLVSIDVAHVVEELCAFFESHPEIESQLVEDGRFEDVRLEFRKWLKNNVQRN